MIHCAKCGAELIGSRKFCAACGTPAGDPRSPAASTGQAPISPIAGRTPAAPGSAPGSGPASSGPAIQYAPAPTSKVNPFAQTAGPAAKSARASDYGPPPASIPPELGSTTPGIGHPRSSPQVSPLAISNVLSQRGAFENAITAGPEAAAAAAAGLFPPVVTQRAPDAAQQSAQQAAESSTRNPIPGTQLMPSMANPPSHGDTPSGATPSSGAASAASSKRPDRTQILGAIPTGSIPRPGGSAPASSGGAPSASASGSGPQVAQPGPSAPHVAPVWPPAQPYAPVAGQPPPAVPYGGAPFAPQQPPPQPPPAPAQQPGAYVFGYVPGSRVTVTWSNGQRYPGTVQQVSGSQCLVVFPDGQHHWVEMQYVAPA